VRFSGDVVRQEGGEPRSALLAVLPYAPVSPFTQARLDETLGLVIGLRAIGPFEGVFDTHGLADTREFLRLLIRQNSSELLKRGHTSLPDLSS